MMLSQSNGPTVAQFWCSTGKCSESKVVFCCFLGRRSIYEDETWRKTADDALEGSEVFVPEGTEGCAIHEAVQKRQAFVVNTLFNR